MHFMIVHRSNRPCKVTANGCKPFSAMPPRPHRFLGRFLPKLGGLVPPFFWEKRRSSFLKKRSKKLLQIASGT
jgi:hypothetical protein